MIDDFEDGMNEVKDEARKHYSETTKALVKLQQKVENTHKLKSPCTSKEKSSIEPTSVKTSSQKTSVPPKDTFVVGDTSKKAKDTANNNPMKKPRSRYQQKPRVLVVGDSIAHNTHFNIAERVTHTTIKTSKACSSALDNAARFRNLNVTAVAKDELEKAEFDNLVLAAPTVDITNQDTSNVKPEDSTEVFKQKVEISCKNMVKVA